MCYSKYDKIIRFLTSSEVIMSRNQKRVITILAIVMLIVVAIDVKINRKLKHAQSTMGDIGYVDLNRTEQFVGDSVFVIAFTENATEFSQFLEKDDSVNLKYLRQNAYRGKIIGKFASEGCWGYEVQVKIPEGIKKITCYGGRPQQNVVFWPSYEGYKEL